MKKYIVTITKALNKKQKIEVEANSKSQIIEKCSIHFGNGIAPFSNNDIDIKSNLPTDQQNFHYEKVDIFQEILNF